MAVIHATGVHIILKCTLFVNHLDNITNCLLMIIYLRKNFGYSVILSYKTHEHTESGSTLEKGKWLFTTNTNEINKKTEGMKEPPLPKKRKKTTPLFFI